MENPKELKSLVKSDGKSYSVRSNRDRFFYPNEWIKFFDALKESQKMTFDILMNTGARINEVINIKVGDIDFERKTIILRVTKIKAKLGEKNPRPRTISISSQFARRLKSYINENDLLNDDTLGLLSKPAAHICLKKTLQRIGITDWYMFSIHNIRKTHGNYLKALQVTSESEICKRLGHDYNTFLKSYVSADIFSFKDRQDMRLILGDLYQR
jgi:integrase